MMGLYFVGSSLDMYMRVGAMIVKTSIFFAALTDTLREKAIDSIASK